MIRGVGEPIADKAALGDARRASISPGLPGEGLRLRTLLACNLGVCLEGFDFIAYTAFAPIFAKLFFPAQNPLNGALLVFGGFGLAYFVRPFGGLFWGLYADRRGRRSALVSISIMTGIGTLLIALAPPYAMIGLLAPLLLLSGRLIQGFAASGEFASATAMLVELAPPRRRAFYASTQMASQVATIGIAYALVLILSEIMSPSALEGWGWRAVFATGALIAPLGLYMRAGMAESPEFVATRTIGVDQEFRIGAMLRTYPVALACIAGLVVVSAAALYLILVFMPVYAVRQLGLPAQDVQLAIILCVTAEIPVILWAAWSADRIGPARFLAPAVIAYTVLAYPLFATLIAHPSMGMFLGVELIAAILLGLLTGPMPAVISALLPTEVRSSGMGLVFNCVGALFGGLGPFLITAYVGMTGDADGPAYWAALTGAIGVLAALAIRRRAASR
jgi:MHS family proline/betaine transporter-like MFS transporter